MFELLPGKKIKVCQRDGQWINRRKHSKLEEEHKQRYRSMSKHALCMQTLFSMS